MPEYRQLLVSTLTSIAVAQAAAGDRAAAAATFQRATGVAESSRFAPVAAMLATIVIAQAEAGDRSAGMAMLERAVAAANSLVPSRPERASSAFATIAKAQAALGERAAAAAALDQALQAAASIQSAMSRSLSLGDVAKAQIRIGDSAAARATLQEALDASRLEEAPDMHRMALMMIAETQAEAGDAAGAARSLQEARAIAESSHSDSMLQEIAAVQAGIGPGSLLEAFPNALAVALKSRGGGVGAGAAPAAPGGDLDAALATAMLIEDPWKRYNALMAISSPWLAAGDYIALQEPMREALVAAQDMGDSGPAFVVLHNLAMVAVAGGNIDGPLGVAKKLATSGTPPYLAASIAWVQAERGDSAGAAASLQVVLEGSASLRIDLRSQLAYLIALAQANMGDLTTALATVDGIADPAMRTRALIAIAADDPPPELQSFMMANLVGQ
jgi:tetratricopeptide (TPR) repeat protein